MREKVTPAKLQTFMERLAASATGSGKVYFTGGATALLLGFRDQTLGIDVKLDPEPKGVFEAIAKLKNELNVNVELASPDDFIPATADWRENSRAIAAIGPIEFFHYDFCLQALAKIERGHEQDLKDVGSFVKSGYVTFEDLKKTFDRIAPYLLRYPAIDANEFKTKVEAFLAKGLKS